MGPKNDEHYFHKRDQILTNQISLKMLYKLNFVMNFSKVSLTVRAINDEVFFQPHALKFLKEAL